MLTGNGNKAGGRERRAPLACDFCRVRKVKCSNERPQCQYCKIHGKDCVYTELPKNPRPYITRIAQLEQETRDLHDTILRLNEQLRETTSQTEGARTNAEAPQNVHQPGLSNSQSNLLDKSSVKVSEPAARVFSPDKGAYFHGATSAAFDETRKSSGTSHSIFSVEKSVDEAVGRQLVAETVKQRQLETVNFLSEKLDFDQVEPELAMHLLSIFWNRQQTFCPIVYRTVFMRDMACRGPYFSKLLLNAIYFYASKYTTWAEVCGDPSNKLSAGWKYRQRAVHLLSSSFGHSDIPTIQALLLMSVNIFSWCDEKSVSWLYAGMAFNMVIDLGMHVDSSTLKRRFSVEDVEVRSRVFWSAYMIDKLQSLYQGRPSCLHEVNTSLSLFFRDTYEELELFDTLSFTESGKKVISPIYAISTFTESCKLSNILERILSLLYAEKSGSKTPEELLNEFYVLQGILDAWKGSLPSHLAAGKTVKMPHVLALFAMYNVLIILLHRPFVSESHLYSISPFSAFDAFSICRTAAFEIDNLLREYGDSYSLKSAPYIISYATYVSATIHVRLAAQVPGGSDAHKALRRCLEILDIHQSVCWAPRIARRVIGGLIARLAVDADEIPSMQNERSDSSTFDIDKIINTFHKGTFSRPAESRSLPSISIVETTTANLVNEIPSLTIQSSSEDGSITEKTGSTNESDMDFIYDPIFGFSGGDFDDFNFEI